MWWTALLWLFGALYVLVVVETILVVILDNRQPAKTMAWLLVLVVIPFVGLLLFYFFGQDVRKERLISRKSVHLLMRKSFAEFSRQACLTLPGDYLRLIRYFEQQNLALPFCRNRVEILTEGQAFITALLQEIAEARHHIHLESYIIEDDRTGRSVRQALIAAARRGVEVRLLYDDVGCWNVRQRFFDEMAACGIQVEGFMPVRFPRFTRKANYRNHRKICIIDGTTGFVGGMNIADRYVDGRDQGPWRDMHLRICGGAVYGLQQTFLTDWYFMTQVLINDTRYYPYPAEGQPDPGTALIQIVNSSPALRWPDMMYGFNWAILNAKRYLYIASPYFMPPEPVLAALQTAAASGVDVRLMVTARPDGSWLRWANASYFADILEAGIRIYRYAPGFLHAKYIVSDDRFTSIGSTNMDFRSFENNFESNAFIYDRETALQVRRQFEEDLLHTTPIDPEQWSRRPYRRRLSESFVRIFSPLL